MVTLYVLGGFALAVVLVANLASRLVFGKLLPDEDTVPFLQKNLPSASLNEYSKSGNLFSLPRGPFISTSPLWWVGVSKWHINEYGCIPKWSKAHRMIEARHKELKPTFVPIQKESLNNL